MKGFSFLISLFVFTNILNAQVELPSDFKAIHFPKLRKNIVVKTIITSDSSYLAIGEKESNIGYNQDLAVLKINKQGEKVWGLIYDDHLDWAKAYDAVELDSGDFIVVGEIKNLLKGNNELIAFKLSSRGEIIWKLKHVLPINSTSRKIVIPDNETIILRDCSLKCVY